MANRLAKAVLAMRSHLGARRPDPEDEPEDAQAWDDLTEAAASLDTPPAPVRGETPVAWFSADVAAIADWHEAFLPEKPHSDGDWRPLIYADTEASPPDAAVRVTEAMVEAGLRAAVDASDARLPRYSVVRAILTAALQGGEGRS